MILKYETDVDVQARFTAVEKSLMGVIQLAAFATTVFLTDRKLFKWPVLITVGSVGGAAPVYMLFWFVVRHGMRLDSAK